MRLLFVTQALDLDDPVLSVYHEWAKMLAGISTSMEAVCLKEGRHDLPDTVTVHSLGKERGGVSSVRYALRFFWLSWKLRNSYDVVFVHMNQEYVLISGLLWKLLGKKVYLWRNHYAGSWLTDIAAAFCEKVFCTSTHSYTAKYRKTVLMPVGVNTERFVVQGAQERVPRSILFFSRIAPSKRVDMFVEALGILKDRGVLFVASVVGSASQEHEDYAKSVLTRATELGLDEQVRFVPAVLNEDAPGVYRTHEIYVNCSPSGMFDKMLFEAAASGCIVLAESEDFKKAGFDDSTYESDSSVSLAGRIEQLLELSETRRRDIQDRLSGLAHLHSLSALSAALAKELTSTTHAPFRLLYATSITYPSPYANRIQTLSTAQELGNNLNKDFCLAANNVQANEMYTNRLVNFNATQAFILAWRQLILCRSEKISAVLCREPSLLFFLILYNQYIFRLPLSFFFEAHGVQSVRGSRFGFILKHCAHVFCITSYIREDLKGLVPSLRASVLPDAVSLEQFTVPFNKESACKEFGIPVGKRVVAYVGSVRLSTWKGDDIFMASWKHVQNPDVVYLVAGARGGDIDYLRDTFPEVPVYIPGWLDRTAVARAMRVADVVVLPNRSGSPASERYTSPMKLFEYMASNTPIVASDLPSVREVLDEDTAVLVPPDNPEALGIAIAELLANPERAKILAQNARALVEERYTWKRRSQDMIETMKRAIHTT